MILDWKRSSSGRESKDDEVSKEKNLSLLQTVYIHAMQLHAKGDLEDAKELYMHILSHDLVRYSIKRQGIPTRQEKGLYLKFLCLKQMAFLEKDDGKSLRYFEKACVLDEKNVELWYQCGVKAFENREYAVARFAFEHVLIQDKNILKAQIYLIMVLFVIEDFPNLTRYALAFSNLSISHEVILYHKFGKASEKVHELLELQQCWKRMKGIVMDSEKVTLTIDFIKNDVTDLLMQWIAHYNECVDNAINLNHEIKLNPKEHAKESKDQVATKVPTTPKAKNFAFKRIHQISRSQSEPPRKRVKVSPCPQSIQVSPTLQRCLKEFSTQAMNHFWSVEVFKSEATENGLKEGDESKGKDDSLKNVNSSVANGPTSSPSFEIIKLSFSELSWKELLAETHQFLHLGHKLISIVCNLNLNGFISSALRTGLRVIGCLLQSHNLGHAFSDKEKLCLTELFYDKYAQNNKSTDYNALASRILCQIDVSNLQFEELVRFHWISGLLAEETQHLSALNFFEQAKTTIKDKEFLVSFLSIDFRINQNTCNIKILLQQQKKALLKAHAHLEAEEFQQCLNVIHEMMQHDLAPKTMETLTEMLHYAFSCTENFDECSNFQILQYFLRSLPQGPSLFSNSSKFNQICIQIFRFLSSFQLDTIEANSKVEVLQKLMFLFEEIDKNDINVYGIGFMELFFSINLLGTYHDSLSQGRAIITARIRLNADNLFDIHQEFAMRAIPFLYNLWKLESPEKPLYLSELACCFYLLYRIPIVDQASEKVVAESIAQVCMPSEYQQDSTPFIKLSEMSKSHSHILLDIITLLQPGKLPFAFEREIGNILEEIVYKLIPPQYFESPSFIKIKEIERKAWDPNENIDSLVSLQAIDNTKQFSLLQLAAQYQHSICQRALSNSTVLIPRKNVILAITFIRCALVLMPRKAETWSILGLIFGTLCKLVQLTSEEIDNAFISEIIQQEISDSSNSVNFLINSELQCYQIARILDPKNGHFSFLLGKKLLQPCTIVPNQSEPLKQIAMRELMVSVLDSHNHNALNLVFYAKVIEKKAITESQLIACIKLYKEAVDKVTQTDRKSLALKSYAIYRWMGCLGKLQKKRGWVNEDLDLFYQATEINHTTQKEGYLHYVPDSYLDAVDFSKLDFSKPHPNCWFKLLLGYLESLKTFPHSFRPLLKISSILRNPQGPWNDAKKSRGILSAIFKLRSTGATKRPDYYRLSLTRSDLLSDMIVIDFIHSQEKWKKKALNTLMDCLSTTHDSKDVCRLAAGLRKDFISDTNAYHSLYIRSVTLMWDSLQHDKELTAIDKSKIAAQLFVYIRDDEIRQNPLIMDFTKDIQQELKESLHSQSIEISEPFDLNEMAKLLDLIKSKIDINLSRRRKKQKVELSVDSVTDEKKQNATESTAGGQKVND